MNQCLMHLLISLEVITQQEYNSEPGLEGLHVYRSILHYFLRIHITVLHFLGDPMTVAALPMKRRSRV